MPKNEKFRSEECQFNRPSSFQAHVNSKPWYLKPFAQFRKASSNASDRENVINSCVSGLLFRSGPNHIARKITGIVFKAFQTPSMFAYAHVVKKILKSFPSFAYHNTASAIIFVSWTIWIAATVVHADPNAVYSGAGLSVPEISGIVVMVSTSTRPTATFSQAPTADCFCFSTRAKA